MVQKVKDRIINSIIMITTGIVISIFSVGYTNNKSDAKILDQKINDIEKEKLGRSEYIEDQDKREVKHQKTHDIDRQDILYIRSRTDDIYKYLLENK